MNARASNKQTLLVALLTVAAIGLLAAIYYSPIWWVSLTAPNYPEEAFPDGVRIHFHMNGVFSGCKMVEKAEVFEEEALDCVHEMDTINHYVGMYPIAAGGVIERAFSPFLVSMLGVMLLGFMIPKPGLRMAVMGTGFAVVAAWMALAYYGAGGLRYQNEGYLSSLVTALNQAAGEEEVAELSPGQALIARLKAEMAKATAVEQVPKEKAEAATDKERYIDNLRVTFQHDQERTGEGEEWNGSVAQMLGWHYKKSLGRYFNIPEEIGPLVSIMTAVAQIVFWLLIGAMMLLVWGARKNRGILYWVLVLVPMALPVVFIIDYSAWLWWYGHSLSEMGAFTVKPFMPTVFGDGKVAQFATHSYPYTGFGLMLASSLLLAVAALIRRKQLKEQD
ncbi:MAG: hypothetical protein U9Q81_00795 [Pseudomonadota bacterium]|nr:hypothetical protein [Pseudomonadota bacterium]